jgi:hypothetical protein
MPASPQTRHAPLIVTVLINHPLRLADHIERHPGFCPEFDAIGQFLVQRLAGGDDHAHVGIVSSGDVRELDAVHIAGELHVSHQQDQVVGRALQHQLGGLGTLAFDDIDIAFLQQQADHVPLHRIVFDDEGRCAKGC